MISGFSDVDKNEDADSSKLQELQQLPTRSPHLIETEYVENRHFSRHAETALGAGALPVCTSLDSITWKACLLNLVESISSISTQAF